MGALSRALPLVPPPQPSWRQELTGDVDGSVFLFGLARFPLSISTASSTVSHPRGDPTVSQPPAVLGEPPAWGISQYWSHGGIILGVFH